MIVGDQKEKGKCFKCVTQLIIILSVDDFASIGEGFCIWCTILVHGQQITRTIENFNNPGNSQIIGEKYFYDQEAIQIAGLKK